MIARHRRAAQAFEDAWGSRRRVDDPRIAGLVDTAERITRVATAEPDPQFQARLRAELMAAAPATMVVGARQRGPLEPASRPRRSRRARLAGALVAAAIAVVGSVGASANAVPGDILYPVKLGTENVERTLARDDAARGRVILDHATTRLGEAEVLSGQDASNARSRIASALDAFSADAQEGAALLLGDPRGQVNEAHAREVATFTDDSAARLAALLQRLAPSDRASAERAVQTLAALGADLDTACPACLQDSQRVAQTVDQLLAEVQRTLTEPASPGAGGAAGENIAPSVPNVEDEPPQDGPDPAPEVPTPSTPAAPEGKPVIALPEPKVPGSVGEIVSPVVGIVLGDDRQVGLVPSLLGVLGLRR